jgi:hypothetical protein
MASGVNSGPSRRTKLYIVIKRPAEVWCMGSQGLLPEALKCSRMDPDSMLPSRDSMSPVVIVDSCTAACRVLKWLKRVCVYIE